MSKKYPYDRIPVDVSLEEIKQQLREIRADIQQMRGTTHLSPEEIETLFKGGSIGTTSGVVKY